MNEYFVRTTKSQKFVICYKDIFNSPCIFGGQLFKSREEAQARINDMTLLDEE